MNGHIARKIPLILSLIVILMGFANMAIATEVTEVDCPTNTNRPSTNIAYVYSNTNGDTVTYYIDVINKPGSAIKEYCVYPTPGFSSSIDDLAVSYPGWTVDFPRPQPYFGFDSRNGPLLPLDGRTNIPVGDATYVGGPPSNQLIMLHIIDGQECGGNTDGCWRMPPVSHMPVNIQPVANSNGPYIGTEGSATNFDGSGSSDSDGSISLYLWDFGDGTTGNGISSQHIYTQNGIYSVTLTVTDNSGATNTSTTTVTIVDVDPVPTFSALPISGDAPLTVTFTDSSSSYDGITLWRWDFDNDGIVDSTEQNVVHQYTSVGIYTVSLEICEADGDCASTTDVITVTGPIVTATPTATATPQGDTIPPSKPLCPVAIAINPTTINVSWVGSTDNVGVVGYKVYRSVDGTNYNQLATVTGLYYVDPGRTTGTTYYYVIIAIDAAGNPSLPSDQAHATPRDVVSPVVTVPSSIIAEATSPSGATVTFSTSATDDIDGTIVPTCNHLSGSVFPIGLTTITCTATDDAGNIGSAIFEITVRDTTPPIPPSGLMATVMGTSRIDLSWGSSMDAVGTIRYIIYRSLNGVDFLSIGTTVLTSFQNSGLMSDTTYYYRISAVDTAGNPSANSSMANARTLAPVVTPPGPTPTATSPGPSPSPTSTPGPDPVPDYPPTLTLPSNTILEATSSSGAIATFSTGAYDNEDSEYKTVTCDHLSGSIFPIGTTYVTCTATDNVGNVASEVFTVMVQDTTPPTSPTGLTATAVSMSRIDLSWAASTDAVGVKQYRIYRRTTGAFVAIGTTTGTSFQNTGLVQNTTYSYYVIAIDNANNPSDQSNTVSAGTLEQPPSPPGPTPTPGTPGPTETPGPSPTETPDPCSPSSNTQIGQAVTVSPAPSVGLRFDAILACGDTTAVAYYENQWTTLPNSYKPVLFYDIVTTSTYSNSITVQVTYSGVPSGINENSIRLFHYENGNWVDITTALDTTSNVVTGVVSSLSPFGLGGTGSGGSGSGTVMRGSSFDIIGLMILCTCLIAISIFRLRRK